MTAPATDPRPPAPGHTPLVCYIVRVGVLGRGSVVSGILWMNGRDSRKLAETIAAKRYRTSRERVSLTDWEEANVHERREAVGAETRALISLL